jgi:hypothetical protein
MMKITPTPVQPTCLHSLETLGLSGDTALIGAYRDHEDGYNDSGSAYVFSRSGTTWGLQTKLTAGAALGGAYDYFGYAVALSGDTALIGAYRDDYDIFGDAGSAYVFTRDGGTWDSGIKLLAADGAGGDNFGHSVAISGDIALIGAHNNDDKGGGSGSAYLFTRSGGSWDSGTILLAGDGESADYFGRAVALSGDTALVGAHYDDDNGSASGSAYFYTFPCAFGHEIDVGKWSMIAPPCGPATPGTVTSAFEDDLLMSGYGSRWILYERDPTPAPGSYVSLLPGDPLDPGLGLWVKSFDPGTLDFEGTPTPMLGGPYCPSDNGCFEIDLTPPASGGDPLANMIGHPLPYGVDLAEVRVLITDIATGVSTLHTLADAADPANNYVSKTFYWHNGTSYESFDDTTPGMSGRMEGFKSVWIKVLNGAWNKTVKLIVPATPTTQTSQVTEDLPWYAHVINFLVPSAHAASDNAVGKDKLKAHQALHAASNRGKPDKPDKTPPEWYIRLIVEQPVERLIDRNSVFGQLSDSIDGFDSHDLPELPPFGDTWLTLCFPHPEWNQDAEAFASDFHDLPAKNGEGDRWTFEVRSNDPGRVLNLSWQGPLDIMEKSTLIDVETGTEVTGTFGSYEFSMNGETRTFEWKIGSGGGKGKKK